MKLINSLQVAIVTTLAPILFLPQKTIAQETGSISFMVIFPLALKEN